MKIVLDIHIPYHLTVEDGLSNSLQDEGVQVDLASAVREWVWDFLTEDVGFYDIEVKVLGV